MVTLTIDGRRVTVDAGASVLDAAKWLGIRIPTMCHVPGIEPGWLLLTPPPTCAIPAVESGDAIEVRP